jgi:hypothetical protein
MNSFDGVDRTFSLLLHLSHKRLDLESCHRCIRLSLHLRISRRNELMPCLSKKVDGFRLGSHLFVIILLLGFELHLQYDLSVGPLYEGSCLRITLKV